MLRELKNTRQVPGENFRRWFSDSDLDLIVWEDEGANIRGFQLCYLKGFEEHAFTWRKLGGYVHHKVDDGEDPGLSHKNSPILIPDGQYNSCALAQDFLSRSNKMDSIIAEFVHGKLLECGKIRSKAGI